MPETAPVEAEFADGYVHSELEHGDVSPFDPTRNIFNDILELRCEAEHGEMVRFSCFVRDERLDIDWHEAPQGARPIRYRSFEQDHNLRTGESSEKRLVGVGFGWQATVNGQNVQSVTRL